MTNNQVVVKVLELVRTKTDQLLKEKTSWGRNDLKMRLESLYTSVAMSAMSDINDNK